MKNLENKVTTQKEPSFQEVVEKVPELIKKSKAFIVISVNEKGFSLSKAVRQPVFGAALETALRRFVYRAGIIR